MKRNRMRRFFQQKQYAVASFVLFAAIAAMTGMYASNRITNERQEQEMAQKEQELANAIKQEDGQMADPFADSAKTPDAQKGAASVTSIIKPAVKPAETTEEASDEEEGDGFESNAKSTGYSTEDADTKNTGMKNAGTEDANTENRNMENTNAKNKNAENAKELNTEHAAGNSNQNTRKQTQDAAAQSKAAVSLNFSPDSDLRWPLQGNVVLNYSMDQTIYFPTLDQYKYNPPFYLF